MENGGSLPDMSNCKKLLMVGIRYGTFSFPGKIPLPKGLKGLHGFLAELDWDEASLRAYFDDGEINMHSWVGGPWLKFLRYEVLIVE